MISVVIWMSEEPPEIEIELEDEYYIEKCLFGDTWSKERAEACQALAMQCNDELNEIPSPKDREKVRRNIINEARFELSKNEDDTIDVKGAEKFSIWSRSNTIFDEGFDAKNFIELLKQKRHGKCSIALYGIETQFWSQINEGLFQNIDNGDAVKNIELLLFSDHVRYATTPRDVRKLQLRDWQHETEGSSIEYAFKKAFTNPMGISHVDSLSEEARDILYNYLVKMKLITPKDFYVTDLSSQLKKYRICNEVHNPFITDGTYKYCSSALTNGKGQALEIWKRKGERYFYTLPEFIGKVTPSTPSIVYLITNIRHARESIKRDLKRASKLDKDDIYHKYYMDRAMKNQWDIKEWRLQLEELKERIVRNNWDQTAALGCWHNFLDMIEKKDYPDYIKGKQKEVEIAYSLGEITEEQATKLLKDIGILEEEFEISINQLDKPIIYQPTRMRIYGSQLALQNLINDAMCRVPLDEVQVDEVTKGKMREGFAGINVEQLLNRRIYNEEEINDLLDELDRLDIHNVLEGMALTREAVEVAGETELEYLTEFIEDAAKSIFKVEELDPIELIFGDFNEFINNEEITGIGYVFPGDEIDLSEQKRKGKKPIIFYEDNMEDEIEINKHEPQNWIRYATEAFPAMTRETLLKKFKAEYYYIHPEVTMYAWYDLNKVAAAADDAIDDLYDLLLYKIVDFMAINYLFVSREKISPVEQFYKHTINDLSGQLGRENYRDLLSTAKDIASIMKFINDKYDFPFKKYEDKDANDLLLDYLHDEAESIKQQIRKRLP